ncbi:hypothetical protein WR25_09707 [Diploscapter pachys]|uniref:Uncharacterized protein n=1 Tax=Diploscapter pachys TaxID=2018661 RepID=A0A2A2KKN3_9BILA|nr:hypothetical protein WR25_09707 [Diploscapter pachys]
MASASCNEPAWPTCSPSPYNPIRRWCEGCCGQVIQRPSGWLPVAITSTKASSHNGRNSSSSQRWASSASRASPSQPSSKVNCRPATAWLARRTQASTWAGAMSASMPRAKGIRSCPWRKRRRSASASATMRQAWGYSSRACSLTSTPRA